MDPILKQKWERLKNGEQVILSDRNLDTLTAYFEANDGPEADLYFRQMATIHNPKRCGTLDAYVAFIKRPRSVGV